jgi:hypothetical protein
MVPLPVQPVARGDDEDNASTLTRRLSPTPPTPIGAVDGVADRSGNLSLA